MRAGASPPNSALKFRAKAQICAKPLKELKERLKISTCEVKNYIFERKVKIIAFERKVKNYIHSIYFNFLKK